MNEQRPSNTRVSDAFNKAVERLGELFAFKQLIREVGGQQAGLERYKVIFSGQTFSEVNELLHDLGVAIRESTAHEPCAGPYCIEPHGDGFALYRGRDQSHHGWNLARITETTPDVLRLIEGALNRDLGASQPPCVDCSQPRVPGLIRCAAHAESHGRSKRDELPILRNVLGNLFAAVQRFGPVDADITFAMREAAIALGPPYSTATKPGEQA